MKATLQKLASVHDNIGDEYTGSIIGGITVGEDFNLHYGPSVNSTVTTTPILDLEWYSDTELMFETENSIYALTLHTKPQ